MCTVRLIHFNGNLLRPRARRASVVDDENRVRRARRAGGRPRARIWTPRTGASRDIPHWDPKKEPAMPEDLQPSHEACEKCLQLMSRGPFGRLIHNLYY